ncbi:NAD+ synthase [Mariniphaga anaerophila]|uniref:NH(3)-dependent NAD(+) synthetase n=1 Tax=Mariniphaga anaerophila TaxID=1484053 RepID=A0A1M5BK08_9BACT|nr:NAD(+) synthase [Mariniphaga anaerophila]SHF42881.1 NAD+ synthase [Mariniphaga anaerophila]
MSQKANFSRDLIKLKNIEQVISEITERLQNDVFNILRRKGAIVGISGGIDSSVTLALAVKALGADRVIGIIMPENDSSDDSKNLALQLAEKFGVKTIEENMTPALEGFGCYKRRDEAVRSVIPKFNPETDKFKIEIKQSILNMKLPPVFNATVYFADETTESKMLPMKAYLQIVAASNFKQRSRMSMLYYHAEANHFAVIGTPNKHEVKQGFFVKYGDGGADIMPIGHLYKTQVYELAEFLEVPKTIIDRTPTTDTYPAEQTQEDFFYQLPFETMDILWYGWENGYSAEEVAKEMGYSPEEISNVFINFERKMKTTDYLRMPPIHFSK